MLGAVLPRGIRRWLIRTGVAGVVLLVLATVFLALEEGFSPGEALFDVLLLLIGDTSVLDVDELNLVTRYFVVAVGYSGILFLAIVLGVIVDYVLRIRLEALFGKRGHKMEDHVILCGFGRIGYRVWTHLHRMGQDVLVVERDENGDFVHFIDENKIPVKWADLRIEGILEQAGIDKARAVIACTDNDLTNLEIALDARALRPDIRVVLRMFDQQMATKIAEGFDIQVAFSTSALAAPAFAAAAIDRSVIASFEVGERTFIYCRFQMPEESKLAGKMVKDLRREYQVNAVSFETLDGSHVESPKPTTPIPGGVTVDLVGPFERIQQLKDDLGITAHLTTRTQQVD